eukprot:454318_1
MGSNNSLLNDKQNKIDLIHVLDLLDPLKDTKHQTDNKYSNIIVSSLLTSYIEINAIKNKKRRFKKSFNHLSNLCLTEQYTKQCTLETIPQDILSIISLYCENP